MLYARSQSAAIIRVTHVSASGVAVLAQAHQSIKVAGSLAKVLHAGVGHCSSLQGLQAVQHAAHMLLQQDMLVHLAGGGMPDNPVAPGLV